MKRSAAPPTVFRFAGSRLLRQQPDSGGMTKGGGRHLLFLAHLSKIETDFRQSISFLSLNRQYPSPSSLLNKYPFTMFGWIKRSPRCPHHAACPLIWKCQNRPGRGDCQVACGVLVYPVSDRFIISLCPSNAPHYVRRLPHYVYSHKERGRGDMSIWTDCVKS